LCEQASFAGIGVLWRLRLDRDWALEPGVGVVVNNGALNDHYPSGTLAAARFDREHQLLGSRDLFRTTFALENVINERRGGFTTNIWVTVKLSGVGAIRDSMWGFVSSGGLSAVP
jgi:hypothetical protein